MCRGSTSWKAFLPEGLNENGCFCLSVLIYTSYHAWAYNAAFQQACILMMTWDTSSLEHICHCTSPWQSVLDVLYSNFHKPDYCESCSIQEGDILFCSVTPLLVWSGNKERFRVIIFLHVMVQTYPGRDEIVIVSSISQLHNSSCKLALSKS